MTGPRKPRAGGGWAAVLYAMSKALEVGPWRLWRRMISKNACKTCALGMGGQLGGMVNERRHFPEVCKKSLQAQVADMTGAVGPEFFDEKGLDALLGLTPKECEDAGRLTFPIIAEEGDDHFRPISWDAAMALTAARLERSTPDRVAFYASGRSSNEAAFLLQSFARTYGTNHVMNCSFYCHQASGVALKMTFGSGTATIALDDLARADFVMLAGANPASNHPRLMSQLAELRARGGEVVVVNPVKETGLVKFHVPSQPVSLIFGTDIASLYVQPLAGGDVALFVGVLKALLDKDAVKKDFLQAHAVNYEQILSDAAALSWDDIVRDSGVSRAQIEEIARRLAAARKAIFCWSMGLTHHTHGVDNVLAVANLALATGNVGSPGCGLLPLRGHSNVQGVGSVGFTPELQAGVRDALSAAYGKPLPTSPGYDTHAMVDAADRGEIETLIALGGNLWGSNPDSRWASRALQNVGTTVYLSTKLNPGHFHGRGKTTIILPVLARDEEPQATTQESMFSFVRLSDGGVANVNGQMRSESQVICDLAGRVLGTSPVDWSRLTDQREVRKLIAEVIPGWQEIANIDETNREFTIAGRVFHEPRFNTKTGRAEMHPTPLPKTDHDGLRLVTLRSEGQFNTVVYEPYDLYRGIPHRHCVLVSAEDAGRLAVRDGQKVTVVGEAGKLPGIEVIVGDIRPGVVAMFYPESNVLIKARPDPRSKTPAFKSAPVWIEP